MKSLTRCAVVLVALTNFGSFALAQMGGACCHSGHCGHPSVCDHFCAGYRANVVWPRQFVPAARRGICDTFAVMTNNGWRRQNLLGAYHFDPVTNKLTSAGEIKVRWILTQAPEAHRTVFVERGFNQEDTTERLAMVEQFASTLSPIISGVDVTDTHIVTEGHRASSVDNVFVGYNANRPPPVLPASTGGASNTVPSGQ